MLSTTNPNANYFDLGQGGNPLGQTSGTPTATVPTPQVGNITSNTLSTQTTPPSTQPQQVPTFDTSGLAATAAGMQSPYSSLTAPQQKEQNVNQSIQDLNSFLSGEGQFKTDQYTAQGFGTTTDANGNITAVDPQMADLNAQLTTLTNNAKAIPLQDANNAVGKNGTQAGVQAADSTNLRNNAIQALQVSSTISARNGALAHATDLVNIATQQKFGSAESQLKAQTANLQLIQNSPDYTNAQKAQAATAAQQVAQQAAALDLQKQDYTNAQNQALQYAGSATAAQMQQLQQGKTPVEVATLATQMGLSTPAQKKILNDLAIQKAQIAQLPLDQQLKRAQVLDAQAGARLKQAQSNLYGGGGAESSTTGTPLSSTDFANGVPLTALGASQSPNPMDSQAFALSTGLAAPSQYLTGRSATTPAGIALTKRANEISMAMTGQPFSAADSESAFKIRNSAKYQNYITSAPNAVRAISEVTSNLQTLSDAGYMTGITNLNSLQLKALASGTEFWAPQNVKSAAANILSTLAQSQDDIGQLLGQGQGSDAKIALSGLIFSQQGGLKTTQDLSQSVSGNITQKLQDMYSAGGIKPNSPFLKAELDRLQPSLNVIGGNSSSGSSNQQTVQSNGQSWNVGQVYNDGTANWTVDAQGKWTKQ